MSKKKSFSAYAVFIWILAIFFYFYEFFLRVLPATVADNIIDSLSMSVEQFALIGSGYYIAYSIMQIPVGLLLDRFSIRLLVTIASFLCTLGALWFSFADGFIEAFIARIFIGIGSSFGFVGLMVVTLNWFPKKYFAFLVGCGQFLGSIGPLCAGGPIALMMNRTHNNWPLIFLGVALFGIALSTLIGIFFKGKPESKQKVIYVDRKDSLKKRILSLLKRSQIWWTLTYAATTYVALPLLGAFWGTSYLKARGFSTTISAFVVSMIWIGLAVGAPVFGRISDKIQRRKPILMLSPIFGLIGSVCLLKLPIDSEWILSIVFFLIGLAGAGQNLSFALITEHAPKDYRGTALGINNTSIMGLAAILPPIVTAIIKSHAVGGEISVMAYEKGLIIIPICYAVSLILSLFCIKETFCRTQNSVHKLKRTY